MPYLEAIYEGESSSQKLRWRKLLPLDKEVTLGRIPVDHPDPTVELYNRAEWVIPEPMDNYVSGCHAIVKWISFQGKLEVRRRVKPKITANPIIYNNRQSDIFSILPGEAFNIGRHKFILYDDDSLPPEDELPPALPIPVAEPIVPGLKEDREPKGNRDNKGGKEAPPTRKNEAVKPVLPPQPIPPVPQRILEKPPKNPGEASGPQPKVPLKDPTEDEGVHVSIAPDALQSQEFVNAHARLKALTRLIDLPRLGLPIEELEKNLLQLLLDALPNATGVALVQLTPDSTPQNAEVRVRRAIKRVGGVVSKYSVSNRLVFSVIRKRPECRLQLWFRGSETADPQVGVTMMGTNGIDWTIVCPLMSEYTQDLGVYIDGELPRNISKVAVDTFEREELHDYQKFVEQAARVLTNARVMRSLDRKVQQLSQFVPPRVLVAMRQLDVQTLFAPRALPVSVLFCDLRSSCKIAEDGVTAASLGDLAQKIREALSVMTRSINTNRGIVGDLQGDAAMGFWGWPTDQPDQMDRAATAALQIRDSFFNRFSQQEMSGMKCGIGIAHGLAIAGAMGTTEHIKCDVFGPVVNLAARLEGMTKSLGVPILVDEEIGRHLREYQPRELAAPRARLMGRYLPAGMTKPVIVYELLPPEGMPGHNMDEIKRRLWEVAVEDFMNGNWVDARQKLDDFIMQDSSSAENSGSTMMSTRPDHLKAAYLMLDFMQRHNYTVPISLQYWRERGAIDLPK